MNQEIFALMAHAEDLQKIARQNQENLNASIRAFPKTAEKAISKAFAKNMELPLKEANEVITGASKGVDEVLKRLWLYPVLVLLFFVFVGSCFFYFGYGWLLDERNTLKVELTKIKTELSQTAEVSIIEGKEGYWVRIDNRKDVIPTTDGGIWARLPEP